MEIGENVWKIVNDLDYFVKDTIGKQLIRSADSIAANISEGFGRYHFKDSKRFYYISRGSLFETKTWLEKSKNRKLITEEIYDKLPKITSKNCKYVIASGSGKGTELGKIIDNHLKGKNGKSLTKKEKDKLIKYNKK